MEKFEAQKILAGQKPVKIGKRSEAPVKKDGMSRRNFLKHSLLGAGAGALYLAEKKYGWLGKIFKNEASQTEHADAVCDAVSEMEKEATEEDIRPAEKVLGPLEKIPVKINRETANVIEEYWYRQYKSGNPRLARSLENAYIAMQPYVPELKKIFAEEGVPSEYLWLAIPESHWCLEARSHAAAVGPYQFIKSTAKKFGLVVESSVDERRDPFKSARACAKNLKYIFGVTGDWDTAASGYNGGFIWPYLRENILSHFGKNYNGFLNYFEWNANAIKEHIMKSGVWLHKIKKGQTMGRIAKHYAIDQATLERENRHSLEARKIGGRWELVSRKNQRVRIPMAGAENKRKVYKSLVRGIAENLNYPPKFNAVVRIINEPDFQKKIQERMKEKEKIMLAKRKR